MIKEAKKYESVLKMKLPTTHLAYDVLYVIITRAMGTRILLF